MVLLILPIFLATSTVFKPVVYATEERKVLSRNYVGLGVEVYAPYQCYPSENVSVRVRVEALEDLKNVSVTVFVWGSKSEGYSPWGTSFLVLDVLHLSKGSVQDAEHDVEIPADISPGLTYGILFLDWSVYLPPSREVKWDKPGFRATYVKNKDYEDLQATYSELQGRYNSVLSDLQSNKTLVYTFLTTTMALAISTTYLARKKLETKRVRKVE